MYFFLALGSTPCDTTDLSIGGVPASEWFGTPTPEGSCTVLYNPTAQKVTISWSGASGGTGGETGGGTGGTTPTEEQITAAQTTNTSTANTIGTLIKNMMLDPSSETNNGVHINVTINRDGTYSIDIDKPRKTKLTKEKIIEGISSVLVNGKVPIDQNDTASGYIVEVHINSGNGQMVSVSVLS